ncbi:MAG TPA: hypothetical protein VMW88_03125, partial [Thermoplasmata archaeon]|nr:hypothetical protein [Thermoplasmata archaeon]
MVNDDRLHADDRATLHARWSHLWVPYGELPDNMKELDRVWAMRTLKALGADGVLNLFLVDGREHVICASIPGECAAHDREIGKETGCQLKDCPGEGWKLVCIRPKRGR